MPDTSNTILNEKDFILTSKNSENRLILVDGHAIAFRAYHALSRMALRTRDGVPTWAAYGFSRILFEIIEEFKPFYMIVTFDTGEPTFRHEMYPEYKANREAAPDDFRVQMPLIIDIVNAFEIPIFQKPGFEADDLIGTLARQASEEGLEVKVVTGDQDLIQLVNEHITVYLPNRDESGLKKFGIDETIEKYGINPSQMVDYKAIIGDKSDNIPGIFGMGPKGASKLIQEYGSLDEIYQNIDNISSERTKKMLSESKEIAYFSQKLSKIDLNVPVELDLHKSHLNKPDESKVRELFTKLEFRTLITSLPKIFTNFYATAQKNDDDDDLWFDFKDDEHKSHKPDLKVNILKTTDEVKELVNKLNTLQYFSIDLETTGVNSMDTEIVGISIADDSGVEEKKAEKFNINYIPVGHILENDPLKNINRNEVMDILRPLLENENVLKIGHNLKYEINVFSTYGIQLRGIKDDTFIADYLINPSSTHGLKDISLSHLNYEMTQISELIGSGKNAITMDKVLTEQSALYAGADSAITLELSFFLRKKLEEGELMDLYEKIELPLVPVLAKMEETGIKINETQLNIFSDKLKSMLDELEQTIYKFAGKEFNINSPKQLSTILFEDMKISPKGVKKNKTSGFSTDAGVLEKLASEHEIVKFLLEYRQLAKLKSTYADSLPLLINKKTGRIHTSYNQGLTTTGRLSSSDPNLQNIPIKTEIGREIRRSFVPVNQDYIILSADYSQIELRLLAYYTQDPIFLEAFEKDIDIHSRTVMDVFNLDDISQVTPELRRIGKTVNFGIVYGQTSYGLSEKLNIPVKRAAEIINKFNETYKSVVNYVNGMVEFAEKYGFVKTLFNRRRYISEIHSSNRNFREFGKRTAVNTPLQGTAADLIKIAMIRIAKALKEGNFKTRMLLQVHDELVFEVPKVEIESVTEMIRDKMENVYPELKVPLKVSINIGDNWIEAK